MIKKNLIVLFLIILTSANLFSNTFAVGNNNSYVKFPDNFNELKVEEQKEILISYIEQLRLRINNLIKKRENSEKNNLYGVFLKRKVQLDNLIYVDKRYLEAKREIEDFQNRIKMSSAISSDNYKKIINDIENRKKIVDEYLSQKKDLVPFYGHVRHAFGHSLIVDPKRAFKGRSAKGYHDYMVTVDETKKILDELYDRNGILVDYNDLYDFSNPSKIVKKQLYLPKGKKPLIISIDDVSYYNYMKGHGFLQKLIIDSDSEIIGKYIKKNGSVEYLRDGDLMMVVDDFIYKHPDFSYNGAKGIIALTGYEGILGYRTNTGNKDLIREAKKVADRLKTLGGKFASHSYQHVEYKTLAGFKRDMTKGIDQVGPIIGDTNIFISPFGYRIPYNDARMKYLNNVGFQVYCPVSAYDGTREHNNVVIMDRIDFDGIRMTISTKFLKPFYDIVDVYDNVNRPIKI